MWRRPFGANVVVSSSRVTTRDPQEVVQSIVKTCSVHLERYVDFMFAYLCRWCRQGVVYLISGFERNFKSLSTHCTVDEMQVIRRCKQLPTSDAASEFWTWCAESDNVKIRGMFIVFLQLCSTQLLPQIGIVIRRESHGFYPV